MCTVSSVCLISVVVQLEEKAKGKGGKEEKNCRKAKHG